MRFLILVKADADSEAMARFHDELSRAGVLLDAGGLQPEGWRVGFEGGERRVTHGAMPVSGYTLIQCKTREEALEWTRRFPLASGEVEVRPLMDGDTP